MLWFMLTHAPAYCDLHTHLQIRGTCGEVAAHYYSVHGPREDATYCYPCTPVGCSGVYALHIHDLMLLHVHREVRRQGPSTTCLPVHLAIVNSSRYMPVEDSSDSPTDQVATIYCPTCKQRLSASLLFFARCILEHVKPISGFGKRIEYYYPGFECLDCWHAADKAPCQHCSKPVYRPMLEGLIDSTLCLPCAHSSGLYVREVHQILLSTHYSPQPWDKYGLL